MTGLISGLPAPTPDAVLDARLAAGITQGDAAALLGLADRRAWWRYESGASVLDPARWALFLLAVGQHPALELTARPLPPPSPPHTPSSTPAG